MESSSMVKRRKVIDDDVHNMSKTSPPDRLSELPDSILFQILSPIPTKCVVQMSILSRRWRYLWTSMPTLDINDNLFFPPQIVLDRYSVENMSFVGFVYKVLLFHDMSHIQRFRLTMSSCDIYASSWIDIIIRKNVQELYLDINEEDYHFQLPDCLFTCESLVSLELNLRDSSLKLPTSICLPRLRTLHLDSVIFSKYASIPKLVSSCPVLENLIMEQCRWWDRKVVNISSPTIRNLCIRDCVTTYSNIKFSIPNLTSFKYIDYFAKSYFFEKFSLIDAFIHIKSKLKNYSKKRYTESFDRLTKLLKGVSNARSLTLSDNTLELLSKAPDLSELLPSFHNLNKLILTSGRKIQHFLVIAGLLQSCPVVESLVINIKVIKEQPSPNNVGPLMNEEEAKKLCLDSLECLLDHLKVVKISSFRGTRNEQKFVKLLLRNANNMERVIIIEVPGDLEKKKVVRKNMLRFKKAAANCIISFS